MNRSAGSEKPASPVNWPIICICMYIVSIYLQSNKYWQAGVQSQFKFKSQYDIVTPSGLSHGPLPLVHLNPLLYFSLNFSSSSNSRSLKYFLAILVNSRPGSIRAFSSHLTYREIHLESFGDTGFKINFAVTSSFNLNFFDFREHIKKIVLIRILTKIFMLESLENRNEIQQKIEVKIRTKKLINISTISW